MTTVNSTYQGTGNFIAYLLDRNGQQVTLLANVIGEMSSSTAFRVPATGDYIVNVLAARGDWQITLVQLGPTEFAQAVPLPQVFRGTGNQNTALFTAEAGAVRVVAKHTGQRNFIVYIINAQGQQVALVANGIGNVSSSQVARLPSKGVYLLVVMADGDWTIEVTQ